MDLTFKELKCPKCGELLVPGQTISSSDVEMVRRCKSNSCRFWMIIVIPHSSYNYKIVREYKPAEKEN